MPPGGGLRGALKNMLEKVTKSSSGAQAAKRCVHRLSSELLVETHFRKHVRMCTLACTRINTMHTYPLHFSVCLGYTDLICMREATCVINAHSSKSDAVYTMRPG